MAEESFFSLPNVFWFAAGLGLEVAFLGIGVSPTGMEWGAEIAESMGLTESFSAVSDSGGAALSGSALDTAASAAVPAATGGVASDSVASDGVEVLDF